MSKKQKRILLRIIVSAITFLFLNLISIKGFLSLFLFLIPFIIVGYDVILKAFKNIIGGQVFDENFLMSVATFGAFAIGEYSEAVAVMLFYQVGELFQSLAVRKSRKSISDLMDIRPDKAVVLRDGCEIDVSPDEVQLGEIIIVKAGEKISLDGIIVKGSASVDSSSLTGESMPLDKQIGDSVLSGTINLNGEIHIKTTSTSAESTVSKILSLVEQAAEKKAKTENFITRFARYYTPIVVISALALCLISPLIFGGGWSEWINRSLIFLVVSCPCALVVSVPLTFFGGIGGCSKKGILVKGAVSLEKLAKADAFVFDKTGTLTKGTFKIEKVCPHNIGENELYGIACSAENHSNHPISKAFEINEEIKTNYIVSEIKEIAGKGICATVNKEKYFLGNKLLMKEQGIDCAVDETGTVIYVSKNNCFIGFIVISDEIKSETAETVNELKKQGISKTFMLTGDNEKMHKAFQRKPILINFTTACCLTVRLKK